MSRNLWEGRVFYSLLTTHYSLLTHMRTPLTIHQTPTAMLAAAVPNATPRASFSEAACETARAASAAYAPMPTVVPTPNASRYASAAGTVGMSVTGISATTGALPERP